MIHLTTTKAMSQPRNISAIRKVHHLIHTQSTERRAMRRHPCYEPRALIKGQQDLAIHTQPTTRTRTRALAESQAMQQCLLQGRRYRITRDHLDPPNHTECMLKTRSLRKI